MSITLKLLPSQLKPLTRIIIGTGFLVTMIMSLVPRHYTNPFMLKTTIPTALPLISDVFPFNHHKTTLAMSVDKELVGARVAWKQKGA